MISVIVPIYNAEAFLDDTIKSILNQSYDKFELLLINDGSTDSSACICEAYLQKDARIKYFIKENSGVSDTRNYGIHHAMGEFLVFVDADDTLPEHALQIYMDTMRQTHADVIFANHSYDYNGHLLPRNPRVKSGLYTYGELQGRLLDDGTLTGILFGSVCGALYKRSNIIKNEVRFAKDVKINEDGLFNIHLLYYCRKIQVIDTVCYHYRQWKIPKLESLKKDSRFDNCERELISLFKERNELDIFKKQLQCRKASIAFWNAIRIRYTETDYKKAKKYLMELFQDHSVKEGLKELDYSNMNKYKRIICKLIKSKNAFVFYIIIKYAAPILERFMNR